MLEPIIEMIAFLAERTSGFGDELRAGRRAEMLAGTAVAAAGFLSV